MTRERVARYLAALLDSVADCVKHSDEDVTFDIVIDNQYVRVRIEVWEAETMESDGSE